jgi:hypothetical protein
VERSVEITGYVTKRTWDSSRWRHLELLIRQELVWEFNEDAQFPNSQTIILQTEEGYEVALVNVYNKPSDFIEDIVVRIQATCIEQGLESIVMGDYNEKG